MKDVQNSRDRRKIPINKVGIKDLHYPVTVLDRQNKSQDTTATINMYVNLPHHFKGTHMSRFVEVLNDHHGRISVEKIEDILREMQRRFKCESVHLEMKFPYFIEKEAPTSGATGLVDYECAFFASLCPVKGKRKPMFDLCIEAAVPVTMLCPCSKEISERGAHNQRSTITIKVRSHSLVWLEEIIEMAENAASSPVYALLKRSDEKTVTEGAYDNPRFAEDAVREVAKKLKKDKRVSWFQVESENQESIHNHSAYAMVVSDPD